ncbi:MAG TPA: 30S ribosomal protein S20 [Thermoanaerobaculia bacterium]|nr:30S ribosomal protein S20 [Thermoanaerobaculia bacterium]
MANTKSAEKRHRQNEKARARNKSQRSRMRTAVKRLQAAVESGDAGAAKQMLSGILGLIDATAQKRIIHANTASRTKSRLAKRVARLQG